MKKLGLVVALLYSFCSVAEIKNFETLVVLHFDKPRGVKTAQCIILPASKPGPSTEERRIVCSGSVNGEFQVWTEPLILPTSATVTIEPAEKTKK
jgi:hypothetical protein